MEAIIPSLLSAATQPLTIIFLVFLLVVFGILIPRDRYIELKDNLKSYEAVTTGLLDEFKNLSDDFKELERNVLKSSDVEEAVEELKNLLELVSAKLDEEEGTIVPANRAGEGRERHESS